MTYYYVNIQCIIHFNGLIVCKMTLADISFVRYACESS